MKIKRRALRLGIFIAAALILFVVAVYLIGSQENLFSSNTQIRASFKDDSRTGCGEQCQICRHQRGYG